MMRVHPRSFRNRTERGANLVEVALVLPLLFLLLMGVADLGRAFYTYVSLTNAAREGARFAARFPFEDNDEAIDEVVARVQDEPNIAGVRWTEVDVTVYVNGEEGLAHAKSGDAVTVTASLELDTILGSIFGLRAINIRTQAVMRIFGVDGATPL